MPWTGVKLLSGWAMGHALNWCSEMCDNKRVYNDMCSSWVGDMKEDMMDLKDPQRFGLAKVITKYFKEGMPLYVHHLY